MNQFLQTLGFAVVLTVAMGSLTFSQSAQPREIGAVNFGRDFEAACSQAKKESKPVFVLFQEIPG